MLVNRGINYVGRKAARLAGRDPLQRLFRGRDTLFIEAVERCSVYGEYGCGMSTVWCANNTAVPILSVDSSADWIDSVRKQASRSANVDLKFIDLGELGDWGRPVSYKLRASFSAYIGALWQNELKPDLVLVDGRFRVACFLRTLASAAPGTTILFDDYTERTSYHVVEEFVSRGASEGTMASFVVPEFIDRQKIEREIEAFTYVMD